MGLIFTSVSALTEKQSTWFQKMEDEYLGKWRGLDQDGVYGAQCVDLVNNYVAHIFPFSGSRKDYANTIGFGSGGQLYYNARNEYFDKIPYYDGFIPQSGDIAVWGGGVLTSTFGHVAVVYYADQNGMILVHQNGSTSQVVFQEGIAYHALDAWDGPLMGFLRPKTDKIALRNPGMSPDKYNVVMDQKYNLTRVKENVSNVQVAKAKAEQEAKAKAEQEAKAKAEQEAKAKAEQEAKAKAEQEAKAKAEQEAKAKAEQEAKAKAEQEAKAKEKQEAARSEKIAKAKEAAKAKETVKAEKEAKEGKNVKEEEILAVSYTEEVKDAEKDVYTELVQLGIIKPSSTNKKSDLLTRAEAITFVLRLTGQEENARKLSAEDMNRALNRIADIDEVPEWSKPYMAYAVENKLISGVAKMPDGKIVVAAKGNISGTHFSWILLNSLGYEISSVDEVQFSYENMIESKKNFYSKAQEQGILQKSLLNRDESAKIIYDFLKCGKFADSDLGEGLTIKDKLIALNYLSEEEHKRVIKN